ncbi:hypothetical protein HAX54_023366 [Datura stramonium]|uniref:Uncharacterized protein n=1 Tax=Datura stramonium TaxID=4076 RepID=A0ABS8S573_DATST|nr:hypothetical protein [Datura stramonium]
MANREEEANFQGDNHGIEPQRKSKTSRGTKPRRDPSATLAIVAAESLTDFRSESSKAKDNTRRSGAAKTERGEKDKADNEAAQTCPLIHGRASGQKEQGGGAARGGVTRQWACSII